MHLHYLELSRSGCQHPMYQAGLMRARRPDLHSLAQLVLMRRCCCYAETHSFQAAAARQRRHRCPDRRLQLCEGLHLQWAQHIDEAQA